MAYWDAEASAWWAERTDVKDLRAEAATLDELGSDVRAVVPELLTVNHGIDQLGEPTKIASSAGRTESLQIADYCRLPTIRQSL